MSVSTPVQGSSSPVGQQLWCRRLDPLQDKARLSAVEIGSAPSEREVQDYARDKALIKEQKGSSTNTLFFLPDQEPIVGILAMMGTEKLIVTPELREKFEISNKKLPPSPVDAAYIAAYGVDVRFRGNGEGYGTLMHEMLIESLSRSMLSPRFISLKVWVDSRAVKFYRDLKYKPFGDPVPEERYGEWVGRQRMVLDRFWTPKSG